MLKIMKRAAILILAVFAQCAFATYQLNEVLSIDGDVVLLDANCGQPLPIAEYYKKHPDRKPKFGLLSSNCWRGYVGHYKIQKDGKFVVAGVEVNGNLITAREAGFDSDYPVFCDWFTSGDLKILRKGECAGRRFLMISVIDGMAEYAEDYFKNEWSSNEDFRRRDGVEYDMRKDLAGDWFDLREICNASLYLSEEDCLLLAAAKKTVKTRGVFRARFKNYYALNMPETRHYAERWLPANVADDIPAAEFDGKFVECEILNAAWGTCRIVKIRELSKSESIHRYDFPRRPKRNWAEYRKIDEKMRDLLKKSASKK